jgi:hypothetical protein
MASPSEAAVQYHERDIFGPVRRVDPPHRRPRILEQRRSDSRVRTLETTDPVLKGSQVEAACPAAKLPCPIEIIVGGD